MYILCNIFKESFNSISQLFKNENADISIWKPFINIEPSLELERDLTDVVNLMVGFSFAGKYNYSEVRVCFDNIVRNIPYSNYHNIHDIIRDFKNRYVNMFDKNHYVDLFIGAIKKIYNSSYDGKLGEDIWQKRNSQSNVGTTYLGIYKDAITIGMPARIGEDDIPFIQIRDVYSFEQDLKNFIEAIKNSQTAYNLFNVEGFTDCYSEDTIIKIIFEAVILNATAYELTNISWYFRKYTKIIEDNILPKISKMSFIGNEFEDEVFFKVKKSDVEYETPWYFAFMLRKHRFELPNVRLAIMENNDGEKIANIIAVQSSQLTRSNSSISEYIKKIMPKSSTFRFYNPDHFVSIVLTFGILNGIGIKKIDIQDFMPIRYRKTVLDCKMNTDEANAYIKRIYDKNIACYYKMMSFTEDINIENNAGSGTNLLLTTNDIIHFNNPFLHNLYMMGYNYGKSLDFNELER